MENKRLLDSFWTRLVYWKAFILYLSLRSMFSSFVSHSSTHHCCCWEHEEKSGLLKIHFVLNFLLNIKLFPTDFIVIQIKFLSGDCRLSMHFSNMEQFFGCWYHQLNSCWASSAFSNNLLEISNQWLPGKRNFSRK